MRSPVLEKSCKTNIFLRHPRDMKIKKLATLRPSYGYKDKNLNFFSAEKSYFDNKMWSPVLEKSCKTNLFLRHPRNMK